MSFAGEVRKELSLSMGKAAHCAVFELKVYMRAAKKMPPTDLLQTKKTYTFFPKA